MAVTYITALKNTRMSAVGVVIDSAATAGILELHTAGAAGVLATLTLGKPCVSGSATAGAITMAGFPRTCTCTTAGTLGSGRVRDGNNADVITGLSCSTGNAEIIVDNTSVALNQLIVVNSIVITHG